MKTLISFFLLLSASTLVADDSTTLEFLGKISRQGPGLVLTPNSRQEILPAHLGEASLAEILKNMEPGEDAFITGHIGYVPEQLEGHTQLKPIFVVESIRPISLERLQKSLPPYTQEGPSFQSSRTYSPVALPVSAEVASAITLTSSFLMLQSLTTPSGNPGVTQQLNQSVLIFSGAIATGVFIYHQLTQKKESL